MARKDDKKHTNTAASTGSARDARLKAALKANMQRRKAQARARRAATEQNAPADSGTDEA